jgi:hypothetical protein
MKHKLAKSQYAKKHTYTLDVLVAGKKGGRIRAALMEDDVRIAVVTRDRVDGGFVPQFVATFLSERSEVRFLTFCNALSASETVELLYDAAIGN